MAGIGSFAFITPILGNIDTDIGPSSNVGWYSTAWILCQGIGSLFGGRVSDIFGRRWVFIMGSVFGLVGSIIAATATSMNQIIGAGVISGLGGGVQVSWFWVVSELVPMKWRYLANSGAYVIAIPTNSVGAKLAYTFQHNTSVRWRGCFYFLIACNAVSVLLWYLFYHPPTFKMLHRRQAFKTLLMSFDWIGLLIYVGSLWTFLMGLGWGGGTYPWKSAPVIASILAGAAGFVVLLLWEAFLPIKQTTPFIPLHLLRNGPLMVVTGITGIGASIYYGTTVIWPQAVAVLYTEYSSSYIGTLYSVVIICYTSGLFVGGIVATFAGNKYPVIVSMTIAAPFLAAAGTNFLDLSLTLGLILPGALAVGFMEGIALTNTSFPLLTQEEIGTAGGLSQTIRLLIGNVAVTVYSATLRTRLSNTIPSNVNPAAQQAGLPESSLPSLLSALSGLVPLDASYVPGLTPAVSEAATTAYKVANAQAFKTVFLVTLAFSVPGMILCWFIKKDDPSKMNFVAQHIHDTKDEKKIESQ
ncbi:hypothetical protein SEUCBS140593_009122 [Sporothrix eucalyptigena]|uniref:Major facilitator superfamily (MFS) profile domain-containing protein n=1 Tax=Sporothrix eucalyptigena TaxID=1812306 RepID=A0ABP0CS94_9PEZI